MAVLPSLEESFGNAIVEAMACGIPVITTNAGSIPEIITQNKNGIMIEPGNSHQLASDIENLLNNPEKRRSLGKSARETVVSKYSWESTAKRYLSIYSDLLDGQIVYRIPIPIPVLFFPISIESNPRLKVKDKCSAY